MVDYSSLLGPAAGQFQQNASWAGPDAGNQTGQVGAAMNMFKQQFNNLLGRDPTPDEMGGFASNALYGAWNAPGDLTYGDSSNLVNSYLNNSFGPQIAQHNQQQQQSQLGDTQKTIQNLVDTTTQNTAKDLLNPTGQTYGAFSGAMNNLGISPSSGAFQAGLGNTLGSNASNAINQALGQVSLPAISGIQGMGMGPSQFSIGNSNTSHLNDIQDWQMQSDLAQRMFNESQPSGFEKNLGYANTASGIAKNFAAFGPSNAGTSYICMALIAHGLATESDLDLLHLKTLETVWKKARAFWWYATHAKELVCIAEEKALDWRQWRKWFLDDPISKPTALEAVEEYIAAYESLCYHLDAMHLWDERVKRVSFWDSLLFLPKIFTYRPFLRAAWRVFRMKHLLLLDLSLSRMPDGTR